MNGRRIALALVVWSTGALAVAHKPSDSYLRIAGGGERLQAQWDIGLRDLEYVIGLDSDQDGQITWGEVKARRSAIAAHALSHLRIVADGQPCQLQVADLLVNEHSDGGYAVLAIETDQPGDAARLEVQYDLLFDIDPTHRGLVLYTNGPVASTHVLTPDEPYLQLETGNANLWNAFVQYVREGVWHIWIGYDHILFLLSLLLPAVLVLREGRWQPVNAFGPACWTVLKIVTVFTVAHSLTLWLAVMEYVTLPGRLVEATIAFSIIITALHNLWPVLPASGWVIAFVFGLVHGFGFANVLLDLGLSSMALGISLFGFNVGVELGQIAIVLIFLPAAYVLRRTWFYRWIVLTVGSLLIAVIAALWFAERVGNVEILGF